MAEIFQRVKPGDLITVLQMNELFDRVEDLVTRVTNLEASSGGLGNVIIRDLVPVSGVVKVGAELQVLGQNFGVSMGAHRVRIDNTPVNSFKADTTDQILVFDVPLTIVDVPAEGRSAILTVSNQTSSAQKVITLLPALDLAGAVDVIWLTSDRTDLASGGPVTFGFRLTSRANLDASFTIDPVIVVAANSQTWQNNLQILDNTGVLIPSKKLHLMAGEEKLFSVRINPIPAGTDNMPFTLTVNATAGTLKGTSGPIECTVGPGGVELPDSTIALSFASAQVLPAGSPGTVTNSAIRLPPGSGAKIKLLVVFQSVGTYKLSNPVLIAPAANWQAQRTSSTPDSYTTIAPNQSEYPEFAIAPAANATEGKIEFRVQRTNSTRSRRLRMDLIPSV